VGSRTVSLLNLPTTNTGRSKYSNDPSCSDPTLTPSVGTDDMLVLVNRQRLLMALLSHVGILPVGTRR
jgi:hypothetical protein